MKKNYKLIKFLRQVGYFDSISKYNDTLKKIFDKKCVTNLIKTLNNRKIITDEDIFNAKFEKKENEKIYDYIYDNKQKNLLEYSYEDYLERQKEIEKNRSKKIEPWSINEKTPRIPTIKKKSFDSYIYRPNYDIIYKRVPSFSFTKSSKKDKKEDKNIEIKNESKTNINPVSPVNPVKKNNTKYKKLVHLINLNTKTNIKIKNKYLPLLTSIPINNKIKTKIQKTNISNNNSRIFNLTQYSPKKEMKNSSKLNKLSVLDSCDKFKSMKKIVNYKKMIPRFKIDSINTNRVKKATMWFYNPKYDFKDPHIRNISFEPKNIKNNKKFEKLKNLRRAMTSYNISIDYLSVDNSKLAKI